MAEEVGTLRVGLTMDGASFTKTIASMDRVIQGFKLELQDLSSKGRDYGKSVEGLSERQEILTKMYTQSTEKVEEQKKKYEDLRKVLEGTVDSTNEQVKLVNDVRTAYEKSLEALKGNKNATEDEKKAVEDLKTQYKEEERILKDLTAESQKKNTQVEKALLTYQKATTESNRYKGQIDRTKESIVAVGEAERKSAEAAVEKERRVAEAASKAEARESAKMGRLHDQALKIDAARNKELERAEAVRLAEEIDRAHSEAVLENQSRIEEHEQALRDSETQWQRLGRVIDENQDKFEQVGRSLTDFGKKAAIGVTAPIMAVGGVSAKAAIDFESAFAGVRKTVEMSEAEFVKLEQGIRGMSKELPTSASNIAEVTESAGQLGIEKDNILEFTRTMIDMGESTNLSSSAAADSFARFANIMQMSQDDFGRLGSSIVELGNNLATTESEIMEMSMRLAGVGNQVGLTESDVLALAGTMSSVGIAAESGGSAMTTTLKKMQDAVMSGSEELQGFADVAGLSTEEFSRAFEERPVEALDKFIGGLSSLGESGENLNEILGNLSISGIQETDAILRLTGAHGLLDEAVQISAKGFSENTALSDEAAMRYETTASKLEILKNNFMDLAISAGDVMIPVIQNVIDILQPFVTKLSEMDDGTLQFIVTVGAIAAAVAPVTIIIGQLVTSIVAIKGAVAAVSGAVIPAMANIGGAIAGATVPVWGIVAAIAAITAGVGFLAYKTLPEATPEIQSFGDNVSEATREASEGFKAMDEDINASLLSMQYGSELITDEMSENLLEKFDYLREELRESQEQSNEEEYDALVEFYERKGTLEEEEGINALETLREQQEEESLSIEEQYAEINEIIANAKEEKRELTEEEYERLQEIRDGYHEELVERTASNLEEIQAMNETAAANGEALNIEAASNAIQHALEVQEEQNAIAEEQHKNAIIAANRVAEAKKDGWEEESRLMKEEADKQLKLSKLATEATYIEVNNEVRKGLGEYESHMDMATGRILGVWERLWNKISGWIRKIDDAWNRILGGKKGSAFQRAEDERKRQESSMFSTKDIEREQKRQQEEYLKRQNELNKSMSSIGSSGGGKSNVNTSLGTSSSSGASQAAKDAQRANEQAAKDAQRAREQAAREAKKANDKAQREAEKRAKDQQRANEKAHKDALKAKEKAEKDALKKAQDKIKAEKAAVKAQYDGYKQQIESRKKHSKVSLMDELKYWEEVQTKFKKGTKEQLDAENEVYKLKVELHNKMVKVTEEVNKKIVDINKRATDEVKKAADEYNKALDDRTRSLYTFAGLFDEIEKKEEVSGKKLQSNLNSQVNAMSNWAKNMRSISDRGIVDKGMLEELQALGPNASAEIEAISKMSDAELEEYTRVWRMKNQLSKAQAANELKDLKKESQDKIDAIKAAAEEEVLGLSKIYEDALKEVRYGAEDQFIGMSSSMQDIGENAVQGLMRGMQDMQTPLMNQAKELADSVSKSMKSELEIRSPSRVTTRIGSDVGEGAVVGVESKVGDVVKAGRRLANALTAPVEGVKIDTSGMYGDREEMQRMNSGGYVQGDKGTSGSEVSSDRESVRLQEGEIVVHLDMTNTLDGKVLGRVVEKYVTPIQERNKGRARRNAG